MLLLLFYIDDDLYALDTSKILEIIPRVKLRKIYHAPEYVTGSFNYRGTIIPTIDLSYLIKGTFSNSYLSTRIIIIEFLADNQKRQYLGLIAEKITETLNVADTQLVNSEESMNKNSYFDRVIIDDRGIIQLIQLDYLLSSYLTLNLLPLQ